MPLVGLAGWVKHVERCEDDGKLRDYTTRGCLGITGRRETVVVERRNPYQVPLSKDLTGGETRRDQLPIRTNVCADLACCYQLLTRPGHVCSLQPVGVRGPSTVLAILRAPGVSTYLCPWVRSVRVDEETVSLSEVLVTSRFLEVPPLVTPA
ncbi:hypothetical protein RRG08_005880 [Elysia crispata]|uniref:Uncharacterized protein n=1 Tax=Elysia crispata TaxID=231223 RepID=A0AAE0ZUH8_9GAST|nr:hypothetical protein RRG08_005880 [Elysia crispata]